MNRGIINSLVLIIAIFLCGCQLAKPEANIGKKQDKLIGVYLTTESLKLYDMDSFFEKNIDKMMSNKEILVSEEYKKRFYAKPSKSRDIHYEFEGIQGVSFFNIEYEDEGGKVHSVANSGEITDVKFFVSDKRSTIEGTLVMGNNASEIGVYINPVYKTEDGKVYLTDGEGTFFIGYVEGQISSESLSEKFSYTENGVTVEEEFCVKVNIMIKNDVEEYVLKEVNDKDEVTQKISITRDNIPDEIIKQKNTAYFILEEHRKNSKGEVQVKRKLIDEVEKGLKCYFLGENNIAKASYIKIVGIK